MRGRVGRIRIGQADGDAGAHLRMRHHGRFDFRRIDVGAAAQDHVGEPVAEIEIAVGVEAGRYRRATPSRRGGRFGVAPR